jgi:hypothetical protein
VGRGVTTWLGRTTTRQRCHRQWQARAGWCVCDENDGVVRDSEFEQLTLTFGGASNDERGHCGAGTAEMTARLRMLREEGGGKKE